MANQAASKTMSNAAKSCSDGSTNIPRTFTTSQASNHHHTASHNIQCSSSPVINDVFIMANSNQQMSLLPNLTDAILETDIFYPLGKLNVTSGRSPSSPKQELQTSSSPHSSSGIPFPNNVADQQSSRTSNSFSTNACGADHMPQAAATSISNTSIKMDVEHSFLGAFNNFSPRPEATPPSNIQKRPIGNTNVSSSYTLVDIKESPNTTPRNVSPVIPAHLKSSINSNDHYLTSTSSMSSRPAGSQILESNSVQPIPLSALRTEAVVNNVNALLSQEILAEQQIMSDNRQDPAKEESITNGDYSLGMTLDDIMNMYRLKGENHYMSETSSNASSCSSVCGWSYGGSSNINGTLEHNNIFDNRMIHVNGKDKGSHVNPRNGNNHHSQFKGSNNFSYKFGLDPIPEYDVPKAPPIFQPLVPPAVVVPNPFKENISFPTTLQARPNDGRFNICRATVSTGVVSTVAQVSSHQKQLMTASNISNTIPPCVMNHSNDDRKSDSMNLGASDKQNDNRMEDDGSNKDSEFYQTYGSKYQFSTDSNFVNHARSDNIQSTPFPTAPDNPFISMQDTPQSLNTEVNSSYQPSPSSRVSSPTLDKLDLNNCNSSQRTSRQYSKPSKRSRSNTPTSMKNNEIRELEARDVGCSSRQRRKSNAGHPADENAIITRGSEARDRSPRREKETSAMQSNSTSKNYDNKAGYKSDTKVDDTIQIGKTKKEDPVKQGLEELQRILPHLGSPGEGKVSQANVLHETGKYIVKMKKSQSEALNDISAIKQKIELLNMEIEGWQGKLPENGAPLLDPAQMAIKRKTLQEMFHGHVVSKVRDEDIWRYWVFTSIMGHFVHSFNSDVDTTGNLDDMQNTATEWIKDKMSLGQLRKDAFRKLSKISAKTSILEDPSKLPQEALSFVQHAQYLPPASSSSMSSSTSSTCSTSSGKAPLRSSSHAKGHKS